MYGGQVGSAEAGWGEACEVNDAMERLSARFAPRGAGSRSTGPEQQQRQQQEQGQEKEQGQDQEPEPDDSDSPQWAVRRHRTLPTCLVAELHLSRLPSLPDTTDLEVSEGALSFAGAALPHDCVRVWPVGLGWGAGLGHSLRSESCERLICALTGVLYPLFF